MSNTGHVQTGFAEANGTTLYYEVAGAGHPFVLVHGCHGVSDRPRDSAAARSR